MEQNLYALIMAGGGGTRLWPLSRRVHPKQVLNLYGDRTMFQSSVDRLLALLPPERIFVVTAEEQVKLLAEQHPILPITNFIIEPEGKGTASCIALSAMHLRRINPDAVMIVVTADHFVEDMVEFLDVIRAADAIAEQNYLVTLGVKPTYAATGYGYIKKENILGDINNHSYYSVAKFTEKPDLDTAISFLKQGQYLWNSGMFVWRVDAILSEVVKYLPQLHQAIERLNIALDNHTYDSELQVNWPELMKQTVDYGIMEKANRVAVIEVDFGWSDIGIWDSVMAIQDADDNSNILLGDVYDQGSRNLMVKATSKRFIATIGLEDIIVIDTPDALLVTRRDQCEKVKSVVDYLHRENRSDLL